MKSTQNLLILTSPPASGKTYWIESFVKELADKSVLIISPLRALADECKMKWGEYPQIVTPEEWLNKPTRADIIIFDEFHLNFYWGDSFRPNMWEAFFALSSQAHLTIALTATLPDWMREEINKFSCHFNQILWLDHGNQKLKYAPTKYLHAPDLPWLERLVFDGPTINGVTLIFCAYREQVFQWQKRLAEAGHNVWSCVGGEAAQMRQMVQTGVRPDFIVATTVLSHGVNLPQISRVIFTYQVKNLDFWIQMVARGGRRGEAYQVLALENPEGIKWNSWTNTLAARGIAQGGQDPLDNSSRPQLKIYNCEIFSVFLTVLLMAVSSGLLSQPIYATLRPDGAQYKFFRLVTSFFHQIRI